MTRTSPRMGADRPQESVDGKEKASGTIRTGKCQACLKKLKPGRHGERKRFCSLDCRRLAWAIRTLGKALAAGHAEGLRGELRRLGDG